MQVFPKLSNHQNIKNTINNFEVGLTYGTQFVKGLAFQEKAKRKTKIKRVEAEKLTRKRGFFSRLLGGQSQSVKKTIAPRNRTEKERYIASESDEVTILAMEAELVVREARAYIEESLSIAQ